MAEKRDYSICMDCKHQGGIWINDYELDTHCLLGKSEDCDNTFECDYFDEEIEFEKQYTREVKDD